MSGAPQERSGPRPVAPLICPYCRDDLGRGAPVLCSGCNTRYHAECAHELYACGTLGCRVALVPRSRAARAPRAHGHEDRAVPAHACTDCNRVVRATEAVHCPSCLAAYHSGCAEDRRTCASKGCERELPVKPAEWPTLLLGLTGLWAVVLTYPVITVFGATTLADPLLQGLLAAAYLPLLASLPAFVVTRRLRQASVRRFGSLAGACALGGLFGLAAVVLWTSGSTTGSRLLAAVFGLATLVTVVVLPSVALSDE